MKKNFKQSVEQIKMSEEMRVRIIQTCHEKMEEIEMSRQTERTKRGKSMVAAAAITLCICLAGTTAMAATGKLQGFFKDIKNWNGAVVGTSYEQATDEMEIQMVEAAGKLTVEVTFADPKAVPYSELEQMAVGVYKIVDENGVMVVEEASSGFSDIVEGAVTINLPEAELGEGTYQLIINEMIGASKADQPLPMSGHWVCEFVIK